MRSLPFIAAVFLLPGSLAQEKPLERQFRTSDVRRYRIELSVTTEIEGQRVEQIGAKAYATPFSFASSEKLTWSVTRRVGGVSADGSAEIEETLDGFSPIELPAPDAKEKTDAALKLALAEWSRGGARTLRYRETRLGKIGGIAPYPYPAPVFDQSPAVLTLWLRHALRPVTALPNHLERLERWNEPRAVELPPWTNVTGNETGAWLPGPNAQIGIVRFDVLHVVQYLSGAVPAAEANAPAGAARFHAESLSTLVGAGNADPYGGLGALMQATRSATREVTRTLDAVPGLPGRPRFRATISIQVQITAEDWRPK